MMIECYNCGTLYDKESKFCPGCAFYVKGECRLVLGEGESISKARCYCELLNNELLNNDGELKCCPNCGVCVECI